MLIKNNHNFNYRYGAYNVKFKGIREAYRVANNYTKNIPLTTWLFREGVRQKAKNLPEIIDKHFPNGCNFYVHACSIGDEVNTFAISLMEKLGENAQKFFPIYGFDISSLNIKQAKDGLTGFNPDWMKNEALNELDFHKYFNIRNLNTSKELGIYNLLPENIKQAIPDEIIQDIAKAMNFSHYFHDKAEVISEKKLLPFIPQEMVSYLRKTLLPYFTREKSFYSDTHSTIPLIDEKHGEVLIEIKDVLKKSTCFETRDFVKDMKNRDLFEEPCILAVHNLLYHLKDNLGKRKLKEIVKNMFENMKPDSLLLTENLTNRYFTSEIINVGFRPFLLDGKIVEGIYIRPHINDKSHSNINSNFSRRFDTKFKLNQKLNALKNFFCKLSG